MVKPVVEENHAYHIRRAIPADAAALAELAARTYADTFGAECRPADLARFLAATYNAVVQGAEIADPRQQTWVAVANESLIAFAQLREGKLSPCVQTPRPLEIRRFYVAHAWHGRGVAQALMRRLLQAAWEHGAESLWLGVYERNYRAVAFYRRHGFVDVGSQDFLFNEEVQTDRVMILHPLPR